MNNGNAANALLPIGQGQDEDKIFATTDPLGANFRYRHNRGVNGVFVDGHVNRVAKGKLLDRNLYINY